MDERISRVIRAYMAYHGITGRSIARMADVNEKMITFVIDGERTSPRVIRAMIKAGIPRALLRRLKHSKRSMCELDADGPCQRAIRVKNPHPRKVKLCTDTMRSRM